MKERRSLRCRGVSSGRRPSWTILSSAMWENLLADPLSLSQTAALFHAKTQVNISITFFLLTVFQPPTPPPPILCFSSEAPAEVLFFYAFLNCNFRTLIACILITFELLSLWSCTNSPAHLNWLPKSKTKE